METEMQDVVSDNPTPDDEWLDDDDAAQRVGAKVIEMADRVTDVAMALPGSQATWHFEVDDRRYKVVVTLAA